MNKNSKFDAIIFDCFGVLTSGTTDLFCDKYFRDCPKKIEQVKDLSHKSDRGEIRYGEFVRRVADLANISETEANLIFLGGIKNQPLFDFIKNTLRPAGYKIGLLSNIGSDRLTQVLSESDLRLFHATTLSYALGIAKPDAKIYKIAAQRLGVSPEKCVFIDDSRNNVLGAEHVGMTGVLYENFSKFQLQLSEILGE
jgi:FMN phosphatase YigB (HAD superfamily)